MANLLTLILLTSPLSAAEPVVTSPVGATQPAWATEFGKDNYGFWAKLQIGDQIQVMRYIPAGNFQIKEKQTVTFSKGFWLGDSEVTQGMWKKVVGTNPSRFTDNDSLPVEKVSWDDCRNFFKKANAKHKNLNLTFPTDGQWEYACRAGTHSVSSDELDAMSWNKTNSDQKSHPVKTKTANAWGLYDMYGNVGEWCSDWYDDFFSEETLDPIGPDAGVARVARGGAWDDRAWMGWSAIRIGGSPIFRYYDLGFRLCAPVQEP